MGKPSAAILVIDLGLTNCKCIVFSAQGEILRRASVSYTTYRLAPGHVEQDTEEWWQAIHSAIHDLWEADPDLASRIDGISVTGHMHALVCLNKEGMAMGRALVLGDQRSTDLAADITDELGLSTIYKITGARMDASMPAAKIRWLREHSPDIHKGTQLFTGCKDYLRHRLTGDRLTDTIDACATSLYSIQARRWSQELISAVGITQDHLPEVHDPTEVAGFLQKEPAYVLGLKAGIPVVVGSGDDIEVLGTGLMGPGCSLEHLGTTGSIMTCSEQPIYDPNMKLELYPHADPDLWVLGGSITAAGSALAWAAETLGYSDLDATLSILSQPLSKLDRTLIFIPHLLGERCPNWNPLVRGAWIGLTNKHTTDDLMYAVFKGVAFALKNILERIEALVGEQKQVTVAQWSNSNSNWLHLRADIYERPLGLLRSREPTALGAMMLAAVGAGLYRNIHEAVEKTTSLERTIESDPRTRATNRRVYTIYQQVVDALVSVWSTL